MKKTLRQFLKFCMVGVVGVSFNYLIFFMFYSLFNVFYVVSSGIGFVSAIFLAYGLNKKYTFEQRRKSKMAFIEYFLVNIFSLFLGLIVLASLVEFLNLNVYFSNFLSLGITTASNFLGSKYIVFSEKKEKLIHNVETVKDLNDIPEGTILEVQR